MPAFYAPDLGAQFSGDTVFDGGPGATGRPFSGLPHHSGIDTDKLSKLSPDTIVHTGHGDTTRIGAEMEHYDEWVSWRH